MKDLAVKGAQELSLERFYAPSLLPPKFHQSASEDYFELLEWFEETPFQDWLYLHHRTLRVIQTTPRTHKDRGFRHKRFIVPDSSGVVLQFFQDVKVDQTPRLELRRLKHAFHYILHPFFHFLCNIFQGRSQFCLPENKIFSPCQET